MEDADVDLDQATNKFSPRFFSSLLEDNKVSSFGHIVFLRIFIVKRGNKAMTGVRTTTK